MRMKNLLIATILVIISIVQLKSNENNQLKSIPKNESAKLQSLLNSYELEKKYYVKDNIDSFEKLLIGNWSGAPHATFSFYKNKQYIMINHLEGDKKTKNKWKVYDNKLCIFYNNNWECSVIDHYKIIKRVRRNKERITIFILFNKPLINLSDALSMKFIKKIALP